MTFRVRQTSFAGGEVSPAMYGRVDLEKYPISLKTCRNMIPGVHGEVYNRGGTYYLDNVRYSATATRLFPFVSAAGQAFILEIGNLYIYVWKNGARIGGVDITTPYSDEDIWDLKFAQSADTLYIAHPDFQTRVLKHVSDDNWPISFYSYVNGPFMFPNTDTTKTLLPQSSQTKIISNFDIFAATHVGALFQLSYWNDSEIQNNSFNGIGAGTAVRSGGTWRVITTGNWSGTLWLERSDDNGTTWQILQKWSSTASDSNVNTFGTEERVGDKPFLLRLNSSVTAGTAVSRLSADGFEWNAIFQVTAFTDNRHVNVQLTNGLPDGLTYIATSIWSEGSWSDYRGWPSTVGFIQDRLTFAATASEPQTWWATKSGNYIDFGRSSPLVDSDGITVNLQSRVINPIVAIRPFLNTALLMTNFSEWSVSSTSGGALTPSTVITKLQGTRGSGKVDPIMVGNRVIFVEPRGSAVRDMEYQYFTDTFTSDKISNDYDHLFNGYTIVDMAYQQEPDSLIWMVRSDGNLICCTYLREQQLIAFSRHDTNNGTDLFESVAVIPGSNVDEVWVVVKRGSNRTIERMLLRNDTTDPHFVDCSFFYNGGPRSSFTGQNQWNGYNVAILADGFVLPQQAISSGTLTLSTPASKIHAGIPYNSDVELLDPEMPTRTGAFQGSSYQIVRICMRFLNTIGGKIGPNSSTLTQPMVHRDNSLSASTPTSNFNGYDPYTMPQDDDQAGHVMYRQSDPLPVTILGVYQDLDPGDDFMLSDIDP